MNETLTLKELFVDALRDAYDAEKQLMRALRRFARSSQNPALETAFTEHLDETIRHVEILEEVFAFLDLTPRARHCLGMAGVIEESNTIVEDMQPSPVRDSALAMVGRHAERYEMAAYLSLIDLSTSLCYGDAETKFKAVLAEEEAMDRKLMLLSKTLHHVALQIASSEAKPGKSPDAAV